jgi:hypothetical protein
MWYENGFKQEGDNDYTDFKLYFKVLYVIIYKLCVGHMIGCHYTQALFHSVLHVQMFLKCDFMFPSHSRWICTLLCYYAVSSGNLLPLQHSLNL